MPAMLLLVAAIRKSIAGVARSYEGTSRGAGMAPLLRVPGDLMDTGLRLPCLTFTGYTAGTGAVGGMHESKP